MSSTNAEQRERDPYRERLRKPFACICEHCVQHGYFQRRVRLKLEFREAFRSPRTRRKPQRFSFISQRSVRQFTAQRRLLPPSRDRVINAMEWIRQHPETDEQLGKRFIKAGVEE